MPDELLARGSSAQFAELFAFIEMREADRVQREGKSPTDPIVTGEPRKPPREKRYVNGPPARAK